MADQAIHQLESTDEISNYDYILVAKKNDLSPTGFTSMKLPAGKLIKTEIINNSIEAFDCLYDRDSNIGSISESRIILNNSRLNYSELIFIFKSGTKISTVHKTNEEIDLCIGSGNTLVLDKLLSGVVPVVGNGIALGLTNGSTKFSLANDGLSTSVGKSTIGYGGKVKSASTDTTNNMQGLYGVTTDGSKSGIQVDMSQSTGIELTNASNTSVTLSDVSTITSIYGVSIAGGISSGSGGVIDGTVLYSEDKSVTLITSPTEVYTTKNDCLLTVQFGSTSTAVIDVQFLIEDNIIYSTTDRSTWDVDTFHIPIKQGITLSAKLFNSIGSRSNFPIKFIEYKLNSLTPQLAVPDWDESKAIILHDGTGTTNIEKTITDNGYILCDVIDATTPNIDGRHTVLINNILVFWSAGVGYGNSDKQPDIIQVSKGDILSIGFNTKVTFYPTKSVSQTNCVSYVIESDKGTDEDGSTWWYRLYSDGWLEQGGTFLHPGHNKYYDLSLKKSYLDNNYSMTFTNQRSNLIGDDGHISIDSITNDSMKILFYDGGNNGGIVKIYWTTSGY